MVSEWENFFLGIFTLVAVVSLICNILTISVIYRHQELNCNVTNIIILNTNIVQAITFFSSPITLRVSMDYYSNRMEMVWCTINSFELTLIFALCWFVLLLISDWYFQVYKNGNCKFPYMYKISIVFIYLIIIISGLLTTHTCLTGTNLYLARYTYLKVLLSFFVHFVTFLIVVNIVHRCKTARETRSSHPGLALANIFILVWIPSLLNLIAIINDASNFVLIVACMIFGFTSPIFSLLYLACYDNEYTVSFKDLFKFKCNENQLLEQEKTVHFGNANGFPRRENRVVFLN